MVRAGEMCKCHPLGRVSISKKAAVPNFFFGLNSLLENPFCKALLEPVISSFDFGHLLDGPLLHRGDPFSHPSGSSAEPKKLFWFLLLLFSLYVQLVSTRGRACQLTEQEYDTRLRWTQKGRIKSIIVGFALPAA